ncbi:peptide ABC transporter permease [Leifsonia xyli subsp. xyli]|uniref:ABC transporter, permease protein n=2 Tax=Leifsonia xyli subsp. xyli TaxID=59736 RepID=Q6ACC8_LEIXX|nr:ABC transporter permease [Leifsonia xyli]AAT89965.1 ABC transporter, permease protein [Leifsonia xyli subsp. xyli str. CTCB07]ODA90053.1 peptide ABC transporter permease [Leifsonia xyli subsp. xyli]
MSATTSVPNEPLGVETSAVPAARSSGAGRGPRWYVLLWRDPKCRVGMFLLAAFLLAAALAPLIAPFDPREAVGGASEGPSAAHWLGTTDNGEDVLSQLIWGAQTSLIVGLIAGLISTAIGLVIGLTAGYSQGVVDEILSFLTNLALVVPVLPLIVTLASYSPVRGIWMIIFVISVTGWAYGARIKRSQVISLRTRDYVAAEKLAGDRTPRIILREIMPNMTSLIVVSFMGAALGAIGGEGGLAFLGLGDPQTVSWGAMLYQANIGGALLTGQLAWLIAPGLTLALLITSFTLINFGIDTLSNPQLREG